VEVIPGKILGRIRVSFLGKKKTTLFPGVVFFSFGLASAYKWLVSGVGLEPTTP